MNPLTKRDHHIAQQLHHHQLITEMCHSHSSQVVAAAVVWTYASTLFLIHPCSSHIDTLSLVLYSSFAQVSLALSLFSFSFLLVFTQERVTQTKSRFRSKRSLGINGGFVEWFVAAAGDASLGAAPLQSGWAAAPAAAWRSPARGSWTWSWN